MRDPNRIDKILEVLGDVWKIVPDWRFGQLISNLQYFYNSKDGDCFFVEDDKMYEFLKSLAIDKGGEVKE